MSKNNQLFYLCQLGGWGALLLLNTAVPALYKQVQLVDVVANVVLFGLALGITSYLRHWFHENNYHSLTIRQLVARLLPISLLVTCLIVIPGIAQMTFVAPQIELSAKMLSRNLMNFEIVMLLWLSLYFGIHTVRTARQQEIDRLRMADSLKAAQLSQLKSQLNPHFIFNSLNNIRGLVYEDADKTSEMITHLSELLRFSLTSKKDSHLLSDELAILKSYVLLNSIQFEHRLVFELNCPVECQNQSVPVMLLQMLAENAIKHGISHLPGGGVLKVDICKQQQHLLISVSNPVSEQTVEPDISTGIGIVNIKERLALLYGDKASFDLQKTPDAKVLVKVKVPWEQLLPQEQR